MANRINKQPEQWSNDELIQWARNKVHTGRDISANAVAKEASARFGLEKDLSVADVKAQIVAEQKAEAETPQETPQEAPQTTETPEDQADVPAQDTVVQTAPAEDEPPVVEPAPIPAEPAPIPKVAPEGAALRTQEFAAQTQAPKVQEKKDVTQQILDDQMNRYLAGMKPGKAVSAKEGAALQVLLWRTIQMVLGMQGSQFTSYFGQLMETVHKNRQGAFSERYAFRFWDNIPLPANERKNFERMLHLLLTTCDPKTRNHSLKQVDLQATLSGFSSSDVQQKVTDFYSI